MKIQTYSNRRTEMELTSFSLCSSYTKSFFLYYIRYHHHLSRLGLTLPSIKIFIAARPSSLDKKRKRSNNNQQLWLCGRGCGIAASVGYMYFAGLLCILDLVSNPIGKIIHFFFF